jgi:hypothetical protein
MSPLLKDWPVIDGVIIFKDGLGVIAAHPFNLFALRQGNLCAKEGIDIQVSEITRI